MPEFLIVAAVAAVITGGFTVASAAITSAGQKEASKKASALSADTSQKIAAEQSATSITLADKQLAADEAARLKAAEEKRIQDDKLAALQEKQLKIQAQQFNIETLAGILRDRKTVSDTPIIYQTPSAKVETGFLADINRFFHNILRG